MGDWDLVHIQKRRRIISKIPQSLNQWEEERGRERERDGHASRGLIFTVDQYRSTYIQGSLIPERGAADRYQEKHGVWVGGRWHLEFGLLLQSVGSSPGSQGWESELSPAGTSYPPKMSHSCSGGPETGPSAAWMRDRASPLAGARCLRLLKGAWTQAQSPCLPTKAAPKPAPSIHAWQVKGKVPHSEWLFPLCPFQNAVKIQLWFIIVSIPHDA